MESVEEIIEKVKIESFCQTKLGVLYYGDCFEIMPLFPDDYFDLCLTDPPYGIGCDKGVGGGILKGKKYEDNWDIRPSKKVFKEILRISRQSIIFGGNFFTDLLPVNNHWIVWDKVGEIAFNNPYSGAELAWTNINKNTVKKYVVIQAGFIAKEKERFHPTQKPVRLFSKIIKDYTIENSLIVDPYLGSGTIAVACEKLGRRWIGIEISEAYCEIAKKRILKEANQGKLF